MKEVKFNEFEKILIGDSYIKFYINEDTIEILVEDCERNIFKVDISFTIDPLDIFINFPYDLKQDLEILDFNVARSGTDRIIELIATDGEYFSTIKLLVRNIPEYIETRYFIPDFI